MTVGRTPYGIGLFVPLIAPGVTQEDLVEGQAHYWNKYLASVRFRELKSFVLAQAPHNPWDEAPLIREPSDVIREMTSLGMMATVGPMYGLADDQQAGASVFMGPLIWDAMPFFWTTDVWHAVEGMARSVPAHVVSHFELGADAVYWCFQHAEIATFQIDGAIVETEMKGVLLSREGAALTWALVGHTRPSDSGEVPKFISMGGLIPAGSRFPDDYEHDAAPWVSLVLAGLAFLESPYIPKSARRLERGLRKRFMAASEPFQDVTFVDLRPASRSDVYEGSDHESTSRDYRCRWIVRGHWREQWYPSLGCHKLKYIPPYIKGPEDKPLKQTVYRVVR